MKLRTAVLTRHDGKRVLCVGMDANCGPDAAYADKDTQHDAAAAHALLQAIKEFRGAPLDSSLTLPEDAINWLEWRSDELMREWGFDDKVTP